MAILLIVRRWVFCWKCWTFNRLTPAPKYFCRGCRKLINTLADVNKMLAKHARR